MRQATARIGTLYSILWAGLPDTFAVAHGSDMDL